MFSKLVRYSDPNSVGSRMRKRRFGCLMQALEFIHQRKGSIRVLDMGGTREYWRLFPSEVLERLNVTITIANLPGANDISERDQSGRFRYVEADCCRLGGFPDGAFDMCHSNSVVEHVGGPDRVAEFCAEMQRLAPYYYLQTPNFYFPIEPHFLCPGFHWLPLSVRARLVHHFNMGNFVRTASMAEATAKAASVQLLTRRKLQRLFPDARILNENFCGLIKSLIVMKYETEK